MRANHPVCRQKKGSDLHSRCCGVAEALLKVVCVCSEKSGISSPAEQTFLSALLLWVSLSYCLIQSVKWNRTLRTVKEVMLWDGLLLLTGPSSICLRQKAESFAWVQAPRAYITARHLEGFQPFLPAAKISLSLCELHTTPLLLTASAQSSGASLREGG